MVQRKALYFNDKYNIQYDRAYIDGLDVSKDLVGYIFEIVIINGKLKLNEDNIINLDHEDLLSDLEETEDKPDLKLPAKKYYKKLLNYALKIGPKSDGFYIRPNEIMNRAFHMVNIIYEKGTIKSKNKIKYTIVNITI